MLVACSEVIRVNGLAKCLLSVEQSAWTRGTVSCMRVAQYQYQQPGYDGVALHDDEKEPFLWVQELQLQQ